MKGKRLISVAMSALILCAQAPAFAVDAPVNTGRVITNLEFNSMATNSIPFGMTVSKAGAFIRQYDEKVENKVLEVDSRFAPCECIYGCPYDERNQDSHGPSAEELACGVVQRELQIAGRYDE